MSNWRSITIIVCAVISVIALAVYFIVLWPKQTPEVKFATYATNTDVAYYIRSSDYTFYLSDNKLSLDVKDINGNTATLSLGGHVRPQGLRINSWLPQAEGNILPPLDCVYV